MLHPLPDVVLTVDPVTHAEEQEFNAESNTVLSPSVPSERSKRRVGSFTLRSKKSENDVKAVTRLSSSTSNAPSIADLLSPRRSQSGSPRVSHLQLTKSGSSEANLDAAAAGSTTPQAGASTPKNGSSTPKGGSATPIASSTEQALTARSLEDALARSPRKEKPSSPSSPISNRGLRLAPVSPALSPPPSRPSVVEEELMVSPREMLREGGEDSPSSTRKQVSPRSKLRRIGISTKNKVK